MNGVFTPIFIVLTFHFFGEFPSVRLLRPVRLLISGKFPTGTVNRAGTAIRDLRVMNLKKKELLQITTSNIFIFDRPLKIGTLNV